MIEESKGTAPSHDQDWLQRADIDSVLESLSADDLIEAMQPGEEQSARMPVRAFNLAATRTGISANGDKASQRIRPGDLKYLIERIGEVVNIDSPLSEGTVASLVSVSTGESALEK